MPSVGTSAPPTVDAMKQIERRFGIDLDRQTIPQLETLRRNLVEQQMALQTEMARRQQQAKADKTMREYRKWRAARIAQLNDRITELAELKAYLKYRKDRDAAAALGREQSDPYALLAQAVTFLNALAKDKRVTFSDEEFALLDGLRSVVRQRGYVQ